MGSPMDGIEGPNGALDLEGLEGAVEGTSSHNIIAGSWILPGKPSRRGLESTRYGGHLRPPL